MCLLVSHSIAGTGRPYPAKSKTLLQILVEELPKRGGWPVGIEAIGQTPGGSLLSTGIGRKPIAILETVASDHANAIITRDQYEAALAEKGIHTVKVECQVVDADGWIEWHGGVCPVDINALVSVKYRNGAIHDDRYAGEYDWTHGYAHSDTNGADIIAYRLHQQQDANSRANDERLKADLNECIGQEPQQEDQTLLMHFLLDEMRDADVNLRLDDAYELAQHLISVGYRKQ